jgi:predicted dehydrogenase
MVVGGARQPDACSAWPTTGRLYPKLLRTRQLIADGAIGRPVLAEANCHGWLPIRERSWLWDRALAGGGPLYDIGSHRIDAFNFLFGRPAHALPGCSRTRCTGWPWKTPPPC